MFRPNFQDTVLKDGDSLTLAEISDDALPAVDIQVFLEQEGRVVGGPVEDLSGPWRAILSSAGFSAGPALAFGVEIRTLPFQTITWTQTVTIQ